MRRDGETINAVNLKLTETILMSNGRWPATRIGTLARGKNPCRQFGSLPFCAPTARSMDTKELKLLKARLEGLEKV